MTPDFPLPSDLPRVPVRLAPAPDDGVLPDNFYSTTNLPTAVFYHDAWHAPREPRMDAVLVWDGRQFWAREPRRVQRSDLVVTGLTENGQEGIYVCPITSSGCGEFQFMTSTVSREKPINYVEMARLLIHERSIGGYPIWVTGPALVHSRARQDMTWFIEQGFVGALLAGNAVAVHDIEASIFGTTLGMNSQGNSTACGHSLHMRAINQVRQAGSIAKAVHQGLIKDGIMHACVTHQVPFVLAGSIRDDGPLPDTVTDAIVAQDAMRAHTVKATMAVLVATALHAIAVGNMLPSFSTAPNGQTRPLPTICVDSSEFVVSKLKDRGTHQAFGVVTNAQDFMHMLRLTVEELLATSGEPV